MSWRQLHKRGAVVQRAWVSSSELRSLAQKRGLVIGLGVERWERWDSQGALCPIAFGLENWDSQIPVDTSEPNTVVFREEGSFEPWDQHAVSRGSVAEPMPLYSLWQLLPLHDVLAGESVDLPVADLLDRRMRDQWSDRLQPLLEDQRDAWSSLDARWSPTLKLLTGLQNRFWPAVSGRVVLPWDARTGARYDPLEREIARFDPLAVLAEHDIDEEHLADVYKWLTEQGALIEGGRGHFTQGGDKWGRLRQLADRRERRWMRGPPLAALDFYDAAEMIARMWREMTGRFLPGIDVVPHRRTMALLDHETVEVQPYARTRDNLRRELVARGVWPGSIHVVVEGATEERWVQRLLAEAFGSVPEELVITNIHGSGGAKRIEAIVQSIADYATSSALIVDAEGEMARYVHGLIDADILRPTDVMMVDSSFEERNFTDGELVGVARRLAANPPGQRPKVKVRLLAKQLRDEHNRRCSDAKPAPQPGLAETLLSMLKDQQHGPVNLKKIELSSGLLDHTLRILHTKPTDYTFARRPIVRFVYRRIADPIANTAWR